MSRVCEVCGRGTASGNSRSHSNIATRRKFQINLQVKKVDGKKAYDRARSGEEFELPARKVRISQLDILEIRHKETTTEADVKVTCSAGTYIRAIARDLGIELKVGGHLNVLRRTRVAGFALDRSIDIDRLKGGDFTTLDLSDVARASFPVR